MCSDKICFDKLLINTRKWDNVIEQKNWINPAKHFEWEWFNSNDDYQIIEHPH
jgi:hypothetical protein